MPRAPGSTDVVKTVIWTELAVGGSLTRAELAARTGLPRSTITDHVRSMLRQHIVDEIATTRPSGRGRHARKLVLARADRLVAVVVLTHSTEIAHGDVRTALGTADGTVRWQDTGPSGGAPLTAGIEAIHRGLRALGSGTGHLDLIVLVVPLPVIREQGLDGLPSCRVVESLAHVLGPDPVTTLTSEFGVPGMLVNDADMAALGEAVHGSGKGHDDLIHVMAVGGIGMGVVLGGRPYARPGQPTSELALLYVPGSTQIPADGDRDGASWQVPVPEGRGLAEVVRTGWGLPGDLLGDVQVACASGDPELGAALQAVGEAIGAALAPFVVLSGIRVVTLQRELGTASGPLARGLHVSLHELSPAWPQFRVDIIQGVLGPLAPVLGALELVRGATTARVTRPVDRQHLYDSFTTA